LQKLRILSKNNEISKEELDMIKNIKLMRFSHIEKLKKKGNYNESNI
jgi:hypothetical protein